MRITNKIMQNNALANMNNNKIWQDKLSTQAATQLKINRPSDDPVIAIRALRLRTNLGEITQYLEKNVPDAESWLGITEDAVDCLSGVLNDMYKECEKGSTGTINSENRAAILRSLAASRDEVYATGDADYEGRSVFTGFRTESKLLFQANTRQQYEITEQLNKSAIDNIKYISTGSLNGVNESNYDSPGATVKTDVKEGTIARIRLAYDGLSTGVAPVIQIGGGAPLFPTVMSSTADPSPYELAQLPANKDMIYFVPETGELLLGSDASKNLQALPADREIRVTYEKSDWEKGDLRPEHYFACTKNSTAANPLDQVVYNPDYLIPGARNDGKQIISYDVGFNQSIQVNTLAKECFTHAIGRDVDELMAVSQQVVDMETTIKKLEAMDGNANYNQTEVKARLEAAKKAHELLTKKEADMYSAGITKMQDHMKAATLAETNIGSRGVRLDLIKNRLSSQQTNFKALALENEGINVAEVATQLDSADLSYNAALMATGKIIQNSLMDFI